MYLNKRGGMHKNYTNNCYSMRFRKKWLKSKQTKRKTTKRKR